MNKLSNWFLVFFAAGIAAALSAPNAMALVLVVEYWALISSPIFYFPMD